MNNYRVLIVCALFVVCAGGVAQPAQAVSTTENLEWNWRGKAWCPVEPNSTQGKFFIFNEVNTKDHPRAGIAITRDPEGTDDFTNLQARLFAVPGAPSTVLGDELKAIIMNGQDLLANKSGNKVEFVLHGVNGTDSHVFVTLRGQATLDPKNLINGVPSIKKASGTFIVEALGDVNTGTGIYCFASGTFRTGKKVVLP
jgi:hypothetical protein